MELRIVGQSIIVPPLTDKQKPASCSVKCFHDKIVNVAFISGLWFVQDTVHSVSMWSVTCIHDKDASAGQVGRSLHLRILKPKLTTHNVIHVHTHSCTSQTLARGLP